MNLEQAKAQIEQLVAKVNQQEAAIATMTAATQSTRGIAVSNQFAVSTSKFLSTQERNKGEVVYRCEVQYITRDASGKRTWNRLVAAYGSTEAQAKDRAKLFLASKIDISEVRDFTQPRTGATVQVQLPLEGGDVQL